FAQALQRREERLGQRRPSKPDPLCALCRLSDGGLARNVGRENEQRHIVSTFLLEQIRAVRAGAGLTGPESRLFSQLTPGARLHAFSVLEMSTGQGPSAGAMRAAPLA